MFIQFFKWGFSFGMKEKWRLVFDNGSLYATDFRKPIFHEDGDWIEVNHRSIF